MSVRPDYFTLNQLLANRLFRIPHYQRAYSWQREHRAAMFDDIKKLRNKPTDSFHFMATVVGLKRKEEEKEIATELYDFIEIVDGQQRITTLVLLLKTIEQKLNSEIPDEDGLVLRQVPNDGYKSLDHGSPDDVFPVGASCARDLFTYQL